MPPSIPRRAAAVSTLCLLATALVAVPAAANDSPPPPLLQETFSDAIPETWSVTNVNTAGMATGWQGWSSHTIAEAVTRWGNSGRHADFSHGEGGVAIVQSDQNRPSSGVFTSTLWTPEIELGDGTEGVDISFDSQYRQGQNPAASLVVRVDGGEQTVVESFSANRYNEEFSASVAVDSSAETVQFGWVYPESSNNWYWMIDNVQVSEAAAPTSELTLLSGTKPVGAPGGNVVVTVGGLRAGEQLSATFGTAETPVEDVPAADADGVVRLTVPIAADHGSGVSTLKITGADVEPLSVPITVLSPASEVATTEEHIWFDGLEEENWSVSSGWAFATRDAVVAEYGTQRRQAFTRATDTIAIAEASRNAVDGKVTSPGVTVTGGEQLQLRVDNHYLVRTGVSQTGTITANFNEGTSTVLQTLGDTSEESAQLRLDVDVPSGATSVQFEFRFEAPAGGGTWMIDDAQLVRPLSALAADATPVATVDVFSDVQGANARLQNQVLPGLRALAPSSDVVVSNGDLVSTGTQTNYNSYLNAFAAGGGEEYETSISTIGNHEFYGSDGSATYIERFLENTGMSSVGDQGGLWGEVLVDGELPVIWIGSEFYDYSAKTGSGPFVSLSDEQFLWLDQRLSYWREQNKPVLLFSHQLLANTVSGSYANFYQNDFDADTERFTALLAANPQVTMVTSHTHWSAKLNDWSVEARFDGTQEGAGTIVNTASVTTQYGPSGDWGEAGIGGADPTGLKVALFDDRLRVGIYSFDGSAAATLVQNIDIAIPTDSDAPVADTERPVTELVSPTTTGPHQALEIEVAARDNVGLQRIVANIYKDGALVKSTQTAADGAASAVHKATVSLPDGSYVIRYNAQDTSGNISATSTQAVTLDATAPTVTVKTGASETAGSEGTYERVSFKLYDAQKIDRLTLNGVEKDLVNNTWSDLNGVRPGAFGGVVGENTLVVYDVAGNTRTVTFTLE